MSLSTSVIPSIFQCFSRKADIDAFVVPGRVTRKLKEVYPHLKERDIGDVISELKEYFHIILESKDRPPDLPAPFFGVR